MPPLALFYWLAGKKARNPCCPQVFFIGRFDTLTFSPAIWFQENRALGCKSCIFLHISVWKAVMLMRTPRFVTNHIPSKEVRMKSILDDGFQAYLTEGAAFVG